MKPTPNPYSGYRYPAEIISHAVWIYFRFALSYRDVEEILAARGIVVAYEAIRQWCLKLGQHYANQFRRRRGHLGDTWYIIFGVPSIRTVMYWIFLYKAIAIERQRNTSFVSC